MRRLTSRIIWKNVLFSILNVWIFLGTIKLACMILFKIKGWFELLSYFWGYDQTKGVYYLVNLIYDNGKGTPWLWVIFGIDCAVLVFSFLWLLNKNRKRKLLIIEHLSLQKMAFTYDVKELTDYAIKKFEMNQYSILNNPDLTTDKMIEQIIESTENSVSHILKYVTSGYQVGYAGIANIPATFLLGYELGDENKKIYFHKFRTDPDDDNFHLLKSEHRQLMCKCNDSPSDPSKPSQMLVLIEFSKHISDADIRDVQESNDYVLKYRVPETIGYDIVDSSKQLNQYTDQIISDIATIEKAANISSIKICIAASSAFIFGLGTKFSKTQDKEIIIYHFQNSTYPWGINVTRKCPVFVDAKTV